MISVIIATYNRSKTFLPKAIESVRNQSYKDWELIIVDDCSTDGTQELCQKYADKPIGLMNVVEATDTVNYLHDSRIRYIRLNKNSGSDTHPKNEGFKESHGEYVLFLDDDVQLRRHALRSLVKHMDKYDVVYGDMWIEPNKQPGIAHDFDVQFLMYRNFIDSSAALMKRECMDYIGGWDETLKKFVDWNVWVRMAKAGFKFHRVHKYTFDYYLHTDTKSQRVVTEMYNHPKLGKLFVPTFDPTGCQIQLSYLGHIREPKVAIFTIHYNRLEYSKKTYNDMINSAKYPFDWFCFDNSSNDETWEWLDTVTCFKERDKANEGITGASNKLIDKIMSIKDYDLIIKIDNDVEFYTDSWLYDIVELWKKNHMLYISPYVEGLRDNPGGAMRKGSGKIGTEYVEVTNHIGGIFAAISAKAYSSFRWTDELKHGNQDVEASAAFRALGYMPCYYPKHIICHRDTTQGQINKLGDYFKDR